MSGPARTFDEQAAVVHGMPTQRPTIRLAAPADQVHGRLILRDWEVAEVLVLETQARAYEEIAISKEALDRIETVTATLRHQEAEVVVEDAGVSGATGTEVPPKA